MRLMVSEASGRKPEAAVAASHTAPWKKASGYACRHPAASARQPVPAGLPLARAVQKEAWDTSVHLSRRRAPMPAQKAHCRDRDTASRPVSFSVLRRYQKDAPKIRGHFEAAAPLRTQRPKSKTGACFQTRRPYQPLDTAPAPRRQPSSPQPAIPAARALEHPCGQDRPGQTNRPPYGGALGQPFYGSPVLPLARTALHGRLSTRSG